MLRAGCPPAGCVGFTALAEGAIRRLAGVDRGAVVAGDPGGLLRTRLGGGRGRWYWWWGLLLLLAALFVPVQNIEELLDLGLAETSDRFCHDGLREVASANDVEIFYGGSNFKMKVVEVGVL